jgi:hypothetical protein
MTRHLLILSIVIAGAIILAAALSACQAPQVCKNCWVSGVSI